MLLPVQCKNNTLYSPTFIAIYLLYAITFEGFAYLLKLNSSIEILVHSDNYRLIPKRFEFIYFI